jgi:hypothetical protein
VFTKKTTGGFSSVPYVVALFSCVLWIFYALIKTNSRLLLTINAFGCGIEFIYIAAYLVYAPRQAQDARLLLPPRRRRLRPRRRPHAQGRRAAATRQVPRQRLPRILHGRLRRATLRHRK